MAALQAADSVFALVAEQAPDSYLGDMWRARTHSAMDPETTEGLAKPYYEKVVDVLLAKNEPEVQLCIDRVLQLSGLLLSVEE